MFITIAVFATLSVISLAIFLVESVSHQRMLRKTLYGNEDYLTGELEPVLITAVRGGEMQETYYYLHESKKQNYKPLDLKIEQSLFKNLVMKSTFSAN